MRFATELDVARAIDRVCPVGRPLRVVAGGNDCPPWGLLRQLSESHLADAVELFMLNAPVGIPSGHRIVPVTPFAGAGMRGNPRLRYMPARLVHVPRQLSTAFVPDLVLVAVAPPWNSRISLGLEVNVLPAAIESCRTGGGTILAEVSPEMPFTLGDGELGLDDVDLVCAPHRTAAIPPPPRRVAAPELRVIGERVAARVPSGSTLQMGIGAVPDAVVPALRDRRNLGIWTELLSEGTLELHRGGALDPSRPAVASFAIGGPDLRAWVHRNPAVRFARTEIVNDPTRIAQNPGMFSLNSALTVDLYDQANASHIGSRLHSGLGGQCDFVTGAMQSEGGQALLALRSWHPKADVSAIVPLLEGPVTSFQHTAVITEQGTAELFGRDASTQAEQLIHEAAHPRVREELRDEARSLGLDRVPCS